MAVVMEDFLFQPEKAVGLARNAETPMPATIENSLLEAFSRGEMTRREIEERVGEAVGFGALLLQLHAHRLPLPRIPSDPHSPGVRLIRELTERAARV